MKVYRNSNQPIQNSETSKSGKLGAGKVGSRRQSGIKDVEFAGDRLSASHLDLSHRAQMMKKAKEVASHSTVDEAKVARLQKLIDAGQYKVDASDIADKLVDTHMNYPE